MSTLDVSLPICQVPHRRDKNGLELLEGTENVQQKLFR